ncbi:hypothetical protein BJX76DRAFT_11993 [Aspergillus varians]
MKRPFPPIWALMVERRLLTISVLIKPYTPHPFHIVSSPRVVLVRSGGQRSRQRTIWVPSPKGIQPLWVRTGTSAKLRAPTEYISDSQPRSCARLQGWVSDLSAEISRRRKAWDQVVSL